MKHAVDRFSFALYVHVCGEREGRRNREDPPPLLLPYMGRIILYTFFFRSLRLSLLIPRKELMAKSLA